MGALKKQYVLLLLRHLPILSFYDLTVCICVRETEREGRERECVDYVNRNREESLIEIAVYIWKLECTRKASVTVTSLTICIGWYVHRHHHNKTNSMDSLKLFG